MLYTSFKTFTEKSTLLENVQLAKDYMIKRAATNYEIEKLLKTGEIKSPSDVGDYVADPEFPKKIKEIIKNMPEERKKMILNTPEFVEIRDLTEKTPAYTGLFTKLHYEQNCPIETIREIADLLKKYKTNLDADLSMPVNDYMNIVEKKTENDNKLGWELLLDELNLIPKKISLRKFSDMLQPKMKKEFRESDSKTLDSLIEYSNLMNLLKPKVDKETGKTLYPWKEFEISTGKYENKKGYFDDEGWKDPKVAFKAMLTDFENFVTAWGQNEDEFLEDVKSLGAKVGILYSKDGYYVFSARNADAVAKIAAVTSFCIKSQSTYLSYAGGRRLQFIVVNKNLPESDNLSIVGITVNEDQSVKNCFDRKNSSVSSNPYTLKGMLKKIGFPEVAIEKVEGQFKGEMGIKVTLEETFTKLQGVITTSTLIGVLTDADREVSAGKRAYETWLEIVGIVVTIITQDENLSIDSFIEYFKQNGLPSEMAIRILKTIAGNKISPEDIKELKEASEDVFSQIDFYLNDYLPKNKALLDKMLKEQPTIIESMKANLKAKDKVMEMIGKELGKKTDIDTNAGITE